MPLPIISLNATRIRESKSALSISWEEQAARLENLRYVLNLLPYNGKDEAPMHLEPDPNVIARFHRKMVVLDL